MQPCDRGTRADRRESRLLYRLDLPVMARWIVLLGMLAAAPSRAQADDSAVFLEVDTGTRPPPAFVCILEPGSAQPYRIDSEDEDGVFVRDDTRWTVNPDAPVSGPAAEVAAVRALLPAAYTGCDLAPDDYCTPQLRTRLTGALSMRCAASPRDDAHGVAVVHVEVAQSRHRVSVVQIAPMSASGSTYRVDFNRRTDRQVTINVVGGTVFEHDMPAVQPGAWVRVPLTPRCSAHTVPLPDAPGGGAASVELREGTLPERSCLDLDASGDTVEVRLPGRAAQVAQRTRLWTRRTHSPGVSERRVTELAAQWRGDTPAALPFTRRRLWFEWHAECREFDRCPEVTLPQARCTATAVDADTEPLQCSYQCEARAGSPGVSLPVEVELKAGGTRWRETLRSSGQELTVASPWERQVPVVLDWASRLDGWWDGAHIHRVEIFGQDGTSFMFHPRSRASIRLEGEVCGREVEYQLHSNRHHSRGVARIEGGSLVIANPRATVRRLVLGLFFGGGYGAPFQDFERHSARMIGFVGATARFPFWGIPRLGLELEARFGITSHPYVPLSASLRASERPFANVPANRYFVTAFFTTWIYGFEIGIAPAAITGFHPLLRQDARAAGGLSWAWAPALMVRHYFDRAISVEAEGRFTTQEPILVHELRAGLNAEVSALYVDTFSINLRLTFWL